ncbi:MAG: phenylalanine--tRNA ligase subunit alpha [Candidatus Sumerlaeaceae bacterium]|nr:phenylalanine--tRNA ligase subunit alpha [Candidatus Sumerlaeaceae bacterium]
MSLNEELKTTEDAALAKIGAAGDVAALERVRPEALGKSSALRGFLRQLGKLPAEERPEAGRVINEAQARVEAAFEEKLATLRDAELARRLDTERVDVTMPPPRPITGSLHPLTLTRREVERIFISMGYEVAEGPEIETEYNNFDALNIKADHPARDMHDTFYLDTPAGGILRTHTSPVQIRYMLKHKPPLAIIAPGRVFRVDDVDATHSPVFHQVEGLLVDKKVSMAHLKSTLIEFLRALYSDDIEIRFRPSYFPFTEPSAEIDMKWRSGKGDTWLEMGGAGMVHPNVLRNVGIDPAEYSGFAFGCGLERLAMLRYGLSAMRPLYENDIRYLRQFR